MSYMLTKTGKQFDYLDPKPEDVDIEDIAHALAHSCRFNGHVKQFYSVAQHSVHVSYRVPPGQELAALFHDAAEAYLGDMVTPLKSLLPRFDVIEERTRKVIALKFGFDPEITREIKQADRILLATERRDLMPRDITPWPCLEGIDPLERRLIPMPPMEAKRLFMDRYSYLRFGPGYPFY